MANFAADSNSQWVHERLAQLDSPGWEPNVQVGWRRIEDRIRRPNATDRGWTWRAAFMILVTLLILPVGLVLAQRGFKWRSPRMVLNGVGIDERLDAVRHAFPVTFGVTPTTRQVSSLAEAGDIVGFSPGRATKGALRDIFQLLRADPFNAAGRIPYIPQFPKRDPSSVAVSDRVTARIHIDAAALQQALRQFGVSDITVPANWDSVSFEVRAGPAILTQYESFTFAQSRSYTVASPAGASVSEVGTMALRIMGYSSTDVADVLNKVAADPVFMLMITNVDRFTKIVRLEILGGPGFLVTNTGTEPARCALCPGPAELVLVWTTADHTYAIKGAIPEAHAVAMAYSIH
jgi:hypothetical protein